MTDPKPEPPVRPLSRRAFNAALATAGASLAVVANTSAPPSQIMADEAGDAAAKAAKAQSDAAAKPDVPKPDAVAKPDAPAKPDAGPPPADTPLPDDADLALQLLLARFPDKRLREPEVQASLRSDLERHRLRSLVLATVPLTNGDEPGFQFGAYRRGGLS
ncbi:MAG: hypothetical protein ACKO38_18180 [Planctomycetota bacterium]